MANIAVTYTFVVEVDDGDSVTDAVEEYVHSVSDPFSDPVKVEDADNPEGVDTDSPNYEQGLENGRNEVKDEVGEAIQAPDTDDPVDTLNALAVYLGIDDYDYFDRRGQWVRYPDTEGN